jgi:hypothetical protein
MIEDIVQLHMTEAELACDLHAVLEHERDAKPVAVIKAPQFRGRPIDECIALAKAHGSHATLGGFRQGSRRHYQQPS